MHKRILGLDLGSNSIGWALVEKDTDQPIGHLVAAGSRILPMSQDILGEFEKGNKVSQTAERTRLRSIRRLRERELLRRERMHRVLHILNFLPEHYARQIDFDKHPGQFLPETEPKLAWRFNETSKRNEFLFIGSFEAMLRDFAQHQPELVANGKKIPLDWTIYYLRKKALTEKIEKEELAWLLLHFNQKRGYNQTRGDEEEEDENKRVEYHALRVMGVETTNEKRGSDTWYNVHLENGWIYRRTSRLPLNWTGQTKDFIVTTELNPDGSVKKGKDGSDKRSLRVPEENEKKTENDIQRSGKTVGAYIYDALLAKCRSACKAGKGDPAVERSYRDSLHYRQAVWHDGDLPGQGSGKRSCYGSAARDVLKRKK
ncbi:MAG: hypothetical protein EOO08_00285 [Chitinophagaceae bacterium]|nr:MAG: hypothetical protein EOO08_00285 [Chitinophagaceae bacterium]